MCSFGLAGGVERGGGLRLTVQRQAILEVLRASDTHPDASWVYQQVRARIPTISLGTVYRNLAQLAAADVIAEIKLHDQASHWDRSPLPHEHVICTACGKVVDVELGALAHELAQRVAATTHYRILARRVQFLGVCPQCQTALDATGAFR
jgi:Fe2+ or Zn2+ uptake regulation protein